MQLKLFNTALMLLTLVVDTGWTACPHTNKYQGGGGTAKSLFFYSGVKYIAAHDYIAEAVPYFNPDIVEDAGCDATLTWKVSQGCFNGAPQDWILRMDYSSLGGFQTVATVSGPTVSWNGFIDFYSLVEMDLVGVDSGGIVRGCQKITARFCHIRENKLQSLVESQYGYVGLRAASTFVDTQLTPQLSFYDGDCLTYITDILNAGVAPTYDYNLYDGATLIPLDSTLERVTLFDASTPFLQLHLLRNDTYADKDYTLKVTSTIVAWAPWGTFESNFVVRHWVMADCTALTTKFTIQPIYDSNLGDNLFVDYSEPNVNADKTFRKVSFFQAYDIGSSTSFSLASFDTESEMHLTSSGVKYGAGVGEIAFPANNRFSFDYLGNLKCKGPTIFAQEENSWSVGFSFCPGTSATTTFNYTVCGASSPVTNTSAQFDWVHTFGIPSGNNFEYQSSVFKQSICLHKYSYVLANDLSGNLVDQSVLVSNLIPLPWLELDYYRQRTVQEDQYNSQIPLTTPDQVITHYVCNYYEHKNVFCQQNTWTLSCVNSSLNITDVGGLHQNFTKTIRPRSATALSENFLPFTGFTIQTHYMCPSGGIIITKLMPGADTHTEFVPSSWPYETLAINNIDLTTPQVIQYTFNFTSIGQGFTVNMTAEFIVCGQESIFILPAGDLFQILVLGEETWIWDVASLQGAMFNVIHPYLTPSECGLTAVELCEDATCSTGVLTTISTVPRLLVTVDGAFQTKIVVTSGYNVFRYDFWIKATSKGGISATQQIFLNNTSCNFQFIGAHDPGDRIDQTRIFTGLVNTQVIVVDYEFYQNFWNDKPVMCPFIGLKVVNPMEPLPSWIKVDMHKGLVVDNSKAIASSWSFTLQAITASKVIGVPVTLNFCGDEFVSPFEGIPEVHVSYTSKSSIVKIDPSIWKSWMNSSVPACHITEWKLFKTLLDPPFFTPATVTDDLALDGFYPIFYNKEQEELKVSASQLRKEDYAEFGIQYKTVSGQVGMIGFTLYTKYNKPPTAFKPNFDQGSADKTEYVGELELGFFDEEEEEVKEVKPVFKVIEGDPVSMEIENINREGNITIKFNQPLNIPSEIQARTENMTLAAIDFEEEIMETILTINNEDELPAEFFSFETILLEWTENKIVVYVNFTEPEAISKGNQFDQIHFKLKDQMMFTSKKTLKYPSTVEEKTVWSKAIPKQLPKGSKQSDLDAAARQAMMGVVISQVVISFFIKSAITRIFQLFFFLQMVCGLLIIQISFPPNVEIIIQNLKLIIFFEILKPDKMLPMIGVNLSLDEILGLGTSDIIMTDPSLLANDVSSVNSLKNLRLYLIILAITICVLLFILAIAVLIPCLRTKLMTLLKAVMLSFFFSGLIKTIYMSYLPQVIQITGSIKLGWIVYGDKFMLDQFINYPILAVFALIIYQFYRVLDKNKADLLHNKELEEKLGSIYFQVKLPTDNLYHTGIFYSVVFLARRFVFTLVPLIFYLQPGLQLNSMITLFLIYSCWMCHYSPLDKMNQKMKVFNEFMLLVLTYNMIILMVTKYDFAQQWNAGLLFIAIVVVAIIVNIVAIVSIVFTPKIKRWRDPKYEKHLRKQNYKLRQAMKNSLSEIKSGEVMLSDSMLAWLRINDPKNKLLPENQNKNKSEDAKSKDQGEKQESDRLIKDPTLNAKRGGGFNFQDEPGMTGAGADGEQNMTGDVTQPTNNKKVLDDDKTQDGGEEGGPQILAMGQHFMGVNIFDMTNLADYPSNAPAGKADPKKLEALSDVYALRPHEVIIQNLLPKNPDHFEIYPSIYPRNKLIRFRHRKLIFDLESRMDRNLDVMPDEYELFLKENAERVDTTQKQHTMNRRLKKTLLAVQPHADPDDFEVKVMRENSCDTGSLEFEMAVTIELGLQIQKMIK